MRLLVISLTLFVMANAMLIGAWCLWEFLRESFRSLFSALKGKRA